MSKQTRFSSKLTLALVCTCVFLPVSAFALSYTITDLGTLPGGGWSTAYGINQAGIVVGGANVSSGNYHAIAWRAGRLKDLGTWNGQRNSTARAINGSNQVAGVSLGPVFGTDHAVMWSAGSGVQNLGSLPGTSNSEAEDINDAGQVVGSAIYSYTHNKAFLWKNGTMTDLGTLGGQNSAAFGINASGQVVGSADTGSGQQHAFRWQNGAMTDLGTPPGWTSTTALGIGDDGKIVGFGHDASDALRAFLYVNGTWTVIGPIGLDVISEAEDVNSSGYVVGFSTTGYLGADRARRFDRRGSLLPRDRTAADSDHAWLYANGVQYDLQTLIPPGSGWTLVDAEAINDNGQIVGTGWSPTGAQHGYLLTPVP
jgi:probable HAF family extracellular repeat protein